VKTVRVVLIGLGAAGSGLHLPAIDRIRTTTLVAACDSDRGRLPQRRDVVSTTDVDAALRIPADAVVIATPPETHHDLARRALLMGRHVYVEKPMTTIEDDAVDLVTIARKHQRTLQVGYAYRHHPLWERLHRASAAGRLRAPFHAEGRFDADAGTGWDHPMLNVGLHHVDALSALAGGAPVEVHAVDGQRLRVRWPDGSELEGIYGPGKGDDVVELSFGGRTVRLDRRRGVRLAGGGVRLGSPSAVLVRSRPATTGWERSFERALRAFARAAAAGHPATPGPGDGLRAVSVGLAITESLRSGAPVRLR
jgi:predicted dehydrogenase